jgi:hypothetical protein
MILLAIDPGNVQSAWCLYDTQKKRPITFGTWLNEYYPKDLACHVPDVDMVVIEKIACYGMAVGETVFETVFWTGKFAERYQKYGIYRIERRDIKMHLCGIMKAKDTNIRQVLIDRFGKPGTKNAKGVLYGIKKDEWAALAVAITYAETRMNSQ